MELKLDSAIQISEVTSFQSYLYGIEMVFEYVGRVFAGAVSIVPLWN